MVGLAFEQAHIKHDSDTQGGLSHDAEDGVVAADGRTDLLVLRLAVADIVELGLHHMSDADTRFIRRTVDATRLPPAHTA